MITVKELSEQLNKSKVSIYKLINKNELKIKKYKGISFLPDETKEFIIEYYTSNNLNKHIEDICNDEVECNEIFDETNGNDIIEILKEQLKIKDNQIESQVKLLEEQTQLLRDKEQTIQTLVNSFALDKQNQTMMLMEKNNENFIGDEPIEKIISENNKQNFFKRLFRRK